MEKRGGVGGGGGGRSKVLLHLKTDTIFRKDDMHGEKGEGGS